MPCKPLHTRQAAFTKPFIGAEGMHEEINIYFDKHHIMFTALRIYLKCNEEWQFYALKITLTF